ncbi:hypothetical protein RIF29_17818 [Crotalaria pallida]|uniref:Uncharacterized protein n=1 Tax=Crotalaria pallida TaxID=3830 RepID=A0AAN9FHZ2_CROPI
MFMIGTHSLRFHHSLLATCRVLRITSLTVLSHFLLTSISLSRTFSLRLSSPPHRPELRDLSITGIVKLFPSVSSIGSFRRDLEASKQLRSSVRNTLLFLLLLLLWFVKLRRECVHDGGVNHGGIELR